MLTHNSMKTVNVTTRFGGHIVYSNADTHQQIDYSEAHDRIAIESIDMDSFGEAMADMDIERLKKALLSGCKETVFNEVFSRLTVEGSQQATDIIGHFESDEPDNSEKELDDLNRVRDLRSA